MNTDRWFDVDIRELDFILIRERNGEMTHCGWCGSLGILKVDFAREKLVWIHNQVIEEKVCKIRYKIIK